MNGDTQRDQYRSCAQACAEGDIERVEAHLDSGVDINGRDDRSGSTWLHTAIWDAGSRALVRFLLQRGACLDVEGLVAAACCCRPDILSLLLAWGADPGAALPETDETPLHFAASFGFEDEATECVRILLEAGADPNVHTKTRAESGAWAAGVYTMGETPLHLAVTFGDEEMVRLLIDAGADIQDAV